MRGASASVWSRLEAVFRDVFEDEALTLRPEMRAEDVDGWDSVAHITLIVELERAFSIKFKNAQVARFECVGDIASALERATTG